WRAATVVIRTGRCSLEMFSMGAILSAAPESQQCRKQEQLIERSAAKGHPVEDAEDFLSALVAALNTLERPSAIDLRMCCFTPAMCRSACDCSVRLPAGAKGCGHASQFSCVAWPLYRLTPGNVLTYLARDQLRIKVRRDRSGMRFMNVPTANIAVDAPVLRREREKDVAILVLNRPDVRNSFSGRARFHHH